MTEQHSESIADSERSPASEAAAAVGSKTGPDDQPSGSPAPGTRH